LAPPNWRHSSKRRCAWRRVSCSFLNSSWDSLYLATSLDTCAHAAPIQHARPLAHASALECVRATAQTMHAQQNGTLVAIHQIKQQAHIQCYGLIGLAKRVRPTPVVDATLAPCYSFEGAGGLAPPPFWPLAAGTGKQQLQPPVVVFIPFHTSSSQH